MAAPSSARQAGRLRQPRIAEIVADVLRERILSGELSDDEMLPNLERLLEEFPVSKPSLREALRILEAEGLITVQRGNVGGAQIHLPDAQQAASTLGMVLQSRRVGIDDVGQALRHLEALSAGMCAEREDRATEVVPQLRQCNEDARNNVDDALEYVRAQAEFHEKIVSLSGNQTLQLVAGALESLWLAHVQSWAERRTIQGDFPDDDYRRSGITDHERMTDLIALGESEAVIRLASSHFDPNQFYDEVSRPTQPIDASLLRGTRTTSLNRQH